MRFYHFSEMPYPYVPPEVEDEYRGLKGFLPNRYYDPVRGYELYQRYLDEYELADQLGFDLMVNEHHQSAATLHCAAPMSAAVIASRTRRGRVLLLGTPLPHRANPVRVAIPRRQHSRRVTAVNSLSAAIAVIALSSRSRRARAKSTASRSAS